VVVTASRPGTKQIFLRLEAKINKGGEQYFRVEKLTL
jgi:hypothetical protein